MIDCTHRFERRIRSTRTIIFGKIMNRYCERIIKIYIYIYKRRINIVKAVEKFINRSANPFD